MELASNQQHQNERDLNRQHSGSGKKQSREWFEALIIAAIFASLLRVFVVESYRIPTGSMEKTLMAGDFIFVNKYVYGAKVPFTEFRTPKVEPVERGDIFVFKYPHDRSLNYIKRCVAVSGDTLAIRQRQLFINGKQTLLPPKAQFLSREMAPGEQDSMIFPRFSGFNKDSYGPMRIPAKGDTIRLTRESFPMYAWLISDEGHRVALNGDTVFIDGAPAARYQVERDYYFAMGDNRDNSLDSRFWGFVPQSDILGRALLVYWSWNPNISLLTDPIDKIASIRWQRTGLLVH
ncbi:signal peptidase I [Chlorobium phaeovibrioides]|uniref:Signal peptidase I n=2 Tax=Chlorobium phaeovibrioides TaxID=1094 RepID=A0A432AW48_CHLPH|nr:signal peptidase I [Chlorobium phaeovibrioides]HCD36386.1 signal peptidase I [Chlorobium sp.]MWV54832.1 signal peptidase I [Chlorobium phaeovibrioides]QEQ56671.1 signal peptidase I [Chlorobium phaeovibrioides]RTY35320.1 signal peptidase I [Chlorobium phaeovibrioides]